MGNAGSTNIYRERHKSADISASNSPFRELQTREADAVGVNANQVTEQAFTFNKKRESVIHTGSSQEDEETTSEPYYTKSISKTTESQGTAAVESEFITPIARKRSSTISEVTTSANNTSNLDNRENNENKDGFEGEYDNEEKNSNDALENDSQGYRNQAMPTVLRWDGGGKQVLISGTFTKWKPIPMVRSHGNFVTIIDLPEGDHQYKFCVDGEWKHDPKLNSIQTPEGDMTNLVTVRQSDFEVFQALAKDSEQMATQTEREYTQDVPQIKPWEKISGPPILPPHLLQVILNKDTPLSCEPTLLPEPNHVMLNHLYALSIKDGVMVLSATHRYRKKYVTTLLYKPI